MRMPIVLAITSSAALAACVVGSGCAAPDALEEEVSATADELLGDALPGTNAQRFAAAKAAFVTVEGPADGLGPIFNEHACGNCHTNGAIGGAGDQIERRFGRVDNGVFNPEANRGGSLRQLFTLGNFNNPSLPAASRGTCQSGNPTLCCVPLEHEPSNTTVHNVGRLTTPVFGLGLVDAMPDSFFLALRNAQPSAIRGVVNMVKILLPNPDDASQAIGTLRVGRFGWKAGVPNLIQFSADAYLNEMGITTQSCFKGTPILDFATESAPNGVPMAAGCDDLAPLQSAAAVAATGMPVNTDDAVGDCSGGLTEIQDDVAAFAEFMTFLAPPTRDLRNFSSFTGGESTFTQIGCAGCHTSKTFTTPNPSPNGVPGGFAFHPFSDFLLHDMGALGDGIGNPGDSVAVTQRMRTAPLWGIRFRNHLLHDGRTSDIATAIRAHAGQGQEARNAFNALSQTRQHDLIQYVRSL